MSDTAPDAPFDVGDRVRIDIPDERRSEHMYHGKNGELIAVIPVGSGADRYERFRVELDIGGAIDVEAEDLRPPI
jgi:ribosomal protein L21E